MSYKVFAKTSPPEEVPSPKVFLLEDYGNNIGVCHGITRGNPIISYKFLGYAKLGNYMYTHESVCIENQLRHNWKSMEFLQDPEIHKNICPSIAKLKNGDPKNHGFLSFTNAHGSDIYDSDNFCSLSDNDKMNFLLRVWNNQAKGKCMYPVKYIDEDGKLK